MFLLVWGSFGLFELAQTICKFFAEAHLFGPQIVGLITIWSKLTDGQSPITQVPPILFPRFLFGSKFNFVTLSMLE